LISKEIRVPVFVFLRTEILSACWTVLPAPRP